MIDPRQPIPRDHIRVSAQIGEATYNHEIHVGQIEATLKVVRTGSPVAPGWPVQADATRATWQLGWSLSGP